MKPLAQVDTAPTTADRAQHAGEADPLPLPIKPSGSKLTCVVPSQYGVFSARREPAFGQRQPFSRDRGHTPPAPSSVFGDVNLAHPFVAWIGQLAPEGITGGCGGSNDCPNAPVTRAQMAVFLVRTFAL